MIVGLIIVVLLLELLVSGVTTSSVDPKGFVLFCLINSCAEQILGFLLPILDQL